MNASRRAEARGGARVGKPRCVRILAITVGSSITARMVKGPRHCGQVVISMAKTRLSNCAQLMRLRVEAEERSPSPLAVFGAWVGLAGNDLGPQGSVGRQHAMEAN